MSRHSLAAGLFKHAIARSFVRRVTPERAFPDAAPVTPAQPPAAEAVATPELAGMDLYPQGRYLQGPCYQPPAPYGLVLPGVRYYPRQDLLLDGRNRAIEDPRQVPMRTHWYDWRAFFPNAVEPVPGSSFVFRSFRGSLYHLLTDHLPDLYLLGALPWDGSERVKLLLPSPLSEAERYLVPRMCPDNVDLVEVEPGRGYRLERCRYVRHLAQRGCGYLPGWYLAEFLRRVAPQRPRVKNARIYVSRAGAATRRIVNEDELVRRLEGLGFTAYALEQLPIARQIELFHDAEIVVAPHGAGLVNLLFAERAKVVELFEGPLLRPHYYFLCKARGHQYVCLRSRDRSAWLSRRYDEFVESFNGSSRDFRVDCDRVLRVVQDLLRDPAQPPPAA